MSFTAKDVQSLRERTGCGMMDCKKALTEADGDMEKAIEILREKGLAAQAKKAGRIAAEGIVYPYVDEEAKVGVLIEVNAETDFVAQNAGFQSFVASCARVVAKCNPATVDDLLASKTDDGTTVEDALRDKILTIGENLKIRRFVRYQGDVVTYSHGGGRIGVMVQFDLPAEAAAKDEFKVMGKDIAMQIAAANPTYIDRASVPAQEIEKEKEILTQQAINEGKPANIAEKMVMGRINKFYKEVCLLEQPFIKDGEISVGKYIDNCSKQIGASIKVVRFTRYEKGEGLEKREDNFAQEVAGMVK